MDGFQATAAIRDLVDPTKAGVPIIAMTAHALKEDADRCLAAGMDAYVSKPIEADEFIELVEFLGEADMSEEERVKGAEALGPGSSSMTHHAKESTQQSGALAEEMAPAFDLKEAVNKCFGKYDFFLDMVGGFFEEMEESLHAMLQSKSRGDGEELGRIAHRLKNTVLYLGARSTTDAISKVESAAKSDDATALDQAMDLLSQRLTELKLALIPYHNQKAETFDPGSRN
jgi:CheY-like chemotaxis protein